VFCHLYCSLYPNLYLRSSYIAAKFVVLLPVLQPTCIAYPIT
jgi:hypothetical protein